jgi:hypothetical protein
MKGDGSICAIVCDNPRCRTRKSGMRQAPSSNVPSDLRQHVVPRSKKAVQKNVGCGAEDVNVRAQPRGLENALVG